MGAAGAPSQMCAMAFMNEILGRQKRAGRLLDHRGGGISTMIIGRFSGACSSSNDIAN
jgi:hypothetical protein